MGYIDRLKHRIRGTEREEPTEYVCENCNAGFEQRRQVCPECGGYSIRRREWGSLR
jgi:rRNA maturation endonuclease Nob1